VPLGLLVTEAITNAYKHAFNEGTGGHIYVDVRRPSADTLELAVRDDGSGFDPAAGEDNTGLGRSLIEAFVRQLRGELEISGDAGTSLVVRFPAPARTPEGGIALSAGPVSATPGDSVAAAPLPSTES
jgi:two-component sensor histidine kinase